MEVMVSFSGDSPAHPDRPAAASESAETPLDPAPRPIDASRGPEAGRAPSPAARPRRRWGRTGVRIAAVGLVVAVASIGVSVTPLRAAFPWALLLKQRTNVLIVGLDRTVSERNPKIVYPVTRATTIVAASFDPASRRAYLLNVPRDTRTSIPGHGTTKINAAHAYGGTRLSIRTVENVLGVRFPYYIELTERGFVRLIDAVGGVNVHIEKNLSYDDNWDGLHIHLKKGYRRLGGKAAMEYVRFRHDPLGDIGRIKRGQQVMNALLDELRQPRTATHLPRMLRVFREDAKTNLSQAQLVTLALFGAGIGPGGLVRETLPGSFGQSDWIPDLPRDHSLVARMFYDMDAEAMAQTTAELLASPADPETATDALARVTALGVRLVRYATSASDSPTAVILHHGDRRVAEIVAALVGARTIIDAPSTGGPDLTVILADSTTAIPAPLARQ